MHWKTRSENCYLKKANYTGCPCKNKQKTQTWVSQESYLSAWEKHRTEYIQLGLTRDSKKKMSVFFFKKLNYYTISLGTQWDYWHFITKQNSDIVSFCLWFSVRKKEAHFSKILWRFMEAVKSLTLGNWASV